MNGIKYIKNTKGDNVAVEINLSLYNKEFNDFLKTLKGKKNKTLSEQQFLSELISKAENTPRGKVAKKTNDLPALELNKAEQGLWEGLKDLKEIMYEKGKGIDARTALKNLKKSK